MSAEMRRILVYVGLFVWAGFWMGVTAYYMDKADRLRRKMLWYRRMAGRR